MARKLPSPLLVGDVYLAAILEELGEIKGALVKAGVLVISPPLPDAGEEPAKAEAIFDLREGPQEQEAAVEPDATIDETPAPIAEPTVAKKPAAKAAAKKPAARSAARGKGGK